MMPLVELSSTLLPHFHFGILPALAAAAPVIGGIGTALTGGAALVNAFKGGGGSSSSVSSSASAGQTATPVDYFSLYGGQAAAASRLASAQGPLTVALQRFGLQAGANMGALATYLEGLSSGQKTILKDAAMDSQAARELQSREVAGMLDAGRSLAKEVGQMKTAAEMLNPTFAATAASESLKADNRLGEALGLINLNIKEAQEGAKLNIAQKYSDTLSSMLGTRAATEGALATGAQRIAGALALNDASTISDLTRNQARVKGDIAKIRANTAATIRLRDDAAGRALTGQSYFA